jgi:hypothetical protein
MAASLTVTRKRTPDKKSFDMRYIMHFHSSRSTLSQLAVAALI